ncbi:hypothetical protein [Glycomyces rhizosphaerae]|uniref:Uncharacterized protein n=1 Tax=Glycomyces rhizosphaerae TaxID=2054422 RepID=A0ABV7PSW5_9ACTN
MSLKLTNRSAGSGYAFLRRHRLVLIAAIVPLAVLLAGTLTVAAPPNGAPDSPGTATGMPEQATGDPNPNYRRVAVSSPGATIEILGQPEPLTTGAITGEVSLARPEGDRAMVAANLVASSDELDDFGQVYLALRPGIPVDYQYDTATQSIVFNPGLEFEADIVPGMPNGGDPVFLYTLPIRMVPTEPVADPQFPPYGQTFSLPSMVLLWEGAEGVTGSEPIGLLTGFELTVLHPA